MRKPRKLSRRKSRKMFTATASRTNKKNLPRSNMRGGYRI